MASETCALDLLHNKAPLPRFNAKRRLIELRQRLFKLPSGVAVPDGADEEQNQIVPRG